METTMAAMLAALALYHTMHAVMEMKSVRYKLNKLDAKISGTSFKEKPFKIDNLGKMVAMMMVMMGLFIGVPFFILKMMGVPMPWLIKMIFALTIMAEVITTIGYNNYHKKVGDVLRRIK